MCDISMSARVDSGRVSLLSSKILVTLGTTTVKRMVRMMSPMKSMMIG